MHLVSLIPLALSLFTTTSASPHPNVQANTKRAPPTTCNGYSELCDRSYGNVTFIGTHNSYGNGSSIMDNQGKGVVEQLVSVARGFRGSDFRRIKGIGDRR